MYRFVWQAAERRYDGGVGEVRVYYVCLIEISTTSRMKYAKILKVLFWFVLKRFLFGYEMVHWAHDKCTNSDWFKSTVLYAEVRPQKYVLYASRVSSIPAISRYLSLFIIITAATKKKKDEPKTSRKTFLQLKTL